MRVVIVGASTLGVATAHKLVKAGHDVVMIDRDRAVLDRLGETLDCGLIHGDVAGPAVLHDARGDGEATLLAVTNHDENNILAALLGRSVGYARVAPKIVNAELDALCAELDLDDALFADETIAQTLVRSLQADEAVQDQAGPGKGLGLVRVAATARHAGPAEDAPASGGARLVSRIRDGEATVAKAGMTIEDGDTLVFAVANDRAGDLRAAYGEHGTGA